MSPHRSSGVAGTVLTGLVTASLMSIAWAQLAHAQQFTLVDETFTFTKALADAGQSHHFVKAVKQPSANWTAPVDYRKGSVHIRTEVMDKPAGGEITQWSICYFGNNGSSYGCSESGPYTTAGVVERDVGMLTWWQNETIDWTKGVKEMAFVMKDKDEGGGHTHKRKDPEHFFPTTVRITMVQVAAGATYDPAMAGLPAAGSGGGGGGVDAGGVTDAAGGGGGAGGSGSAVDAAATGGSSDGSSSGGSAATGGAGTGGGGSSTGGSSGSGGAAGSPSSGGSSGGGASGSGGSSGGTSGGSSGGGTSRSGGSSGGGEPPASSGGTAPACAVAIGGGSTPGAGVIAPMIGLALALAIRRRRRQ
jgi:MYXO-CTERM domain-containing protein